MSKVKVTVDLEILGVYLTSINKKYVTLKEISRLLGVSTKTAGKIMAKLERAGVVERYSARAFMLRKH
ncbi:MAG: winged helix-turn-helix transcriptional regulator [Desulfurococcales archaeon]|nr:winged helix-turn-helix transcriptional regulator [Desulfurococcales archaeon]